jgi:hypothetical protein
VRDYGDFDIVHGLKLGIGIACKYKEVEFSPRANFRVRKVAIDRRSQQVSIACREVRWKRWWRELTR